MYLIKSTSARMSPKIAATNSSPPAVLPLGCVKNVPRSVTLNAKARKAMQKSEAADLQSARRSAFSRWTSSAGNPIGRRRILAAPITTKMNAVTTEPMAK